MVTDYIKPDEMDCVLMALMPVNRLVCRVCLATGYRVGDVLALTRDQVARACDTGRLSLIEDKTSKRRAVSVSKVLMREVLAQSGSAYAFPHRDDARRHRTRQAVFKDVKKAAKALRIRDNVAPHSLRKIYAVKKYRASGDIRRVRDALNHDNELVTLLYALADQLPVVKAMRSASRGKSPKARAGKPKA